MKLVSVIDWLEDPIFIVDSHRTVVFSNVSAKRVVGKHTGIRVDKNRLHLISDLYNTQIDRLLLTCAGCHTGAHDALRVVRRGSRNGWMVLVTSFPSAKTEDAPIFCLRLVGRKYSRRVPEAMLQKLFGLTKNERAVAARLVRRDSLKQIATHMDLSHESIRAYLKRIFRKCEVNSQMELLSLLHKLSLFLNLVFCIFSSQADLLGFGLELL